MREAGAELLAWLQEGAHFYVCGDAKRMAKDVEAALVAIAIAHGGKSAGRRQGVHHWRLKVGRPLSDGRLLMAQAARTEPVRPAPPAPIAASVAACWPRRTGLVARPSPVIPQHPANFGRLCSKGAALGETLGLEKRLLQPRFGNRRVGWAERSIM